MFKGLTKTERAWVLYDVGNSAYTMLACSLIPIWFKELAIGTNPGQITGDKATAYYSISVAIVTVIVAVLGPVCGAIADHKDMKKIFFTTSMALGVIGCILNGFAPTWMAFLVIFVLAKIFYSASLTFYDSMLNDVTTEDRMDQVSHICGFSDLCGRALPRKSREYRTHHVLGICSREHCILRDRYRTGICFSGQQSIL